MEKPETDQAVAPSGIGAEISRFIEDQGKAASDAKTQDAAAKEAEKKPESAAAAADAKAEVKAEAKAMRKFRIVDESGKDIPFPLVVDGQEILVDDAEKLSTYAQLGYHGSQRNADLNKREQELNTQAQMIGKIAKALEEGRLIIKSAPGEQPPAKVEKAAGAEEEGDAYVDPDLLKERQARQKLEQSLETLKGVVFTKMVDETKTQMDAEIIKEKGKFPYAREKDVWKLLADQDDEGKPKFTLAEAVKASHEEVLGIVKEVTANDPSFTKKSDEEKKEIIAEYLRDKAEKEKAPVSAPSGAASTETVATKKEPEFKGLHGAIEAFNKDFGGLKEKAKTL
jgi:hypothetical protein